MLFRPVYGPELLSIYGFVSRATKDVSRQDIYRQFLLSHDDQQGLQSDNIDDALSFLSAAGLMLKRDGRFYLAHRVGAESFQLMVVRQLQALNNGFIEPSNNIDPLYFHILEELFIKPDCLYIANVHKDANKLRAVAQVNGLSQEKIRSWKRVMTFLGVGRRIGQGFQCIYLPELVANIFNSWEDHEGFIQTFLESHFASYLPFRTQKGELSQAVQQPLLYLIARGELTMQTRQDSPKKPYFGQERLHYIKRVEA